MMIVLSSWAPTIMTIFVGGYLASVLFPRWQQQYQISRQRTERRMSLAEEIARFLTRYIMAWRRLIQIATLESQRELTDEERERKDRFIEDRNESRDELYDRLNTCPLYFSTATCKVIDDFARWDDANSSKHLGELPSIDEWRVWKRRMLKEIRDDINRF